MDDLQSEKEQIEEIRAWWAEYGRYIIAGAVLMIGLIIGINQHNSSKLEAQVQASALFEELAGHVGDGDLADAEAVADQLASNYANTVYAPQSKLAMARLYMDKNRDQDAADTLRELLEMRGHGPLKNVGRVRLARILLYQDKPQDVLQLLEDQPNEAFAGLYAELRGDANAALGRYQEAGEAYREALADPTQTVNRGLVQMKLVDLPEPQDEPDSTPALPEADDDATPAPGASETPADAEDPAGEASADAGGGE